MLKGGLDIGMEVAWGEVQSFFPERPKPAQPLGSDPDGRAQEGVTSAPSEVAKHTETDPSPPQRPTNETPKSQTTPAWGKQRGHIATHHALCPIYARSNKRYATYVKRTLAIHA